MKKGGNVMREVHIYRGHEHYVVRQENKINNVEIKDNKEEVKEEKKRKEGKRNEEGNSDFNRWK